MRTSWSQINPAISGHFIKPSTKPLIKIIISSFKKNGYNDKRKLRLVAVILTF